MSTNRGWDEDAAEYVSNPPPNLQPLKEKVGPDWLRAQLQEPVRVAAYPFDMAVDLILKGTGVTPKFDYGMDLSLPVALEANGNVGDALNAISARTNYSFEIKENIVVFHQYETKVFILPVPGGDYSYMVGKGESGGGGATTGGGSSGSQSIDTSAFDVDQKQYSNTQVEKVNVIADAYTFAKQIVGKNGSVALSKATSSILVKTTPDKMSVVTDFMNTIIDDLTTQVALEVMVVQVTTKKGGDIGVNWNAVKNITDGQLNFLGQATSTNFTAGTPFGFSGTEKTSLGSVDILVNALQQQGKVSFLTKQNILTRSGKLSELELSEIKGYLESSSVTQTTDVGSSTELQPGIIQSGYSLYSYAKVFQNKVALVVSNRASDLDPFEKVGTEENFIQIPTMRSNRFNVQQIITDGTTVVAASVRRQKSSTESSSFISPSLLPGYMGAGSEIVDIYVLVTPRIVRAL